MSSTTSSISALFTPLKFTGVSSYSSDFQTIIDRAVSIASLPLSQAQNQQTDLLAQKTLLSSLNSAVTSMGDAVAALGKLGANRGIQATSSDTSKLTINSTTASSAATYTITEVTSLAKAASETSATGYATSDSTTVSASGSVQLMVGSKTYDITLDSSDNNLVGLRDAINNLNAGVTASVLTTGTGANPNYLSLSANTSGATTLRLVEDPTGTATDLLTTSNQGSDTVFKLNGVTVEKTTNVINDVVPGVSFTLLDTTDTDESLSITLSSDSNSLSSALEDLVTAYNTAAEQVNAQIGEDAGLLSGNAIVREVQTSLRSLLGYSGTGTIQSLAELGIEMSKDGTMSFNSDTFDALTSTQIEDAFTFLGSTTSGLGALASKFTSISDPVTGMIKLEQDQLDKTDSRLTDRISEISDRITNMQTALASKLEVADQLLASLESQQSILNSSIDSLNYAIYGKLSSSSS
jgi:flagellar hook-associated protein 2